MAVTASTVPAQKRAKQSPTQHDLVSEDETRSADGRLVSEEEYWADYYEHGSFSYEWNNGRLEVRPVGDYAQFRLYLWFIGLLQDFLYVNPIARIIGLEMGFRLQVPSKVSIRKPDLGVVLHLNTIPLADKDRSYHGIFDLCLESISDSTKREVRRDTVTKKREYAAAGVPEYYIIDETGADTAFYALQNGVYLPIPPQDGIIRSNVLPGFQFRLADVYTLPEPPQLILDPVYSGFISPHFRTERLRAEQERLRAEQERLRAEQERLRAEQERLRAERYAALLRSLGVAVEDLE